MFRLKRQHWSLHTQTSTFPLANSVHAWIYALPTIVISICVFSHYLITSLNQYFPLVLSVRFANRYYLSVFTIREFCLCFPLVFSSMCFQACVFHKCFPSVFSSRVQKKMVQTEDLLVYARARSSICESQCFFFSRNTA